MKPECAIAAPRPLPPEYRRAANAYKTAAELDIDPRLLRIKAMLALLRVQETD